MTSLAAICRHVPPADPRPDGELLAAFLADDEPAFAELLRRHGPMVWGVCRRLLPDPADAEDAFQAAFLVLVRRGKGLSDRATVGPWLYKVAAWTARNLRRRNARRLARREPLFPATADPAADPEHAALRLDLDAALLGLPEKYRTALVLCHLEGWSRRDAAERLGCPEGTLSSLLARGLAKLRARLAGHDPAKALAVGTAVVPTVLLAATARAASGSRLAASAALSSTVSQLAEGVLRMFWVQKATAASVALAAVFAFGVGVGVSVRQAPTAAADDTADDPFSKRPAAPAPDAEKELARLKLDLFVAETKLQTAVGKVRHAELLLEAVEKARVKPEEVAEARDRLKLTEREHSEARKTHDDLKARIKALEAKAPQPKPPGNPPAAPPKAAELLKLEADARDLEKLVTRLNEELARLEVSRQKLDAEKATIAEQLETLQRRLKQLQERKDQLKPAPPGTDLGGAVRPAAAGTTLEITVTGKDALWPFSIKETAGRKAIGTAICDTPEMLARLLARAAKDPDAPKVLAITAHADAPVERVKAVLEACKAAGFHQATFRSQLPGPAGGWETELRIDPGGKLDELLKLGGKPIDPLIKPPAEPKP